MKLNPEDEGLPAHLLALKPSPDNKMHWGRWTALCQLVSAHETLALGAYAQRINIMSKKSGQDLSMINFSSQLDQAQQTLLQIAGPLGKAVGTDMEGRGLAQKGAVREQQALAPTNHEQGKM